MQRWRTFTAHVPFLQRKKNILDILAKKKSRNLNMLPV